MEKLHAQLRETAESIKKQEEEKKKLANKLKSGEFSFKKDDDILEESLRIKTIPDSLEKRVFTGIDGGLLKKECHGMDFVLTRAVAAEFEFRKGVLFNVNYYPFSLTPPRTIVLTHALQSHDFELRADYERQKEEISLAIKMTEKKPDILLLDGSIVPHQSKKAKKDSEVRKNYEDVLGLYKELYRKSLENKVLLAGIVEDSRGGKFCSLVKNKLDTDDNGLEKTRDTHFLFYLLEKGERTPAFRYALKEHPVLNDMGENASNIYSFYLRTVELDRPLRIDFLANKNIAETASEIASLILPISEGHSDYGIPSVIIEADKRAKLGEDELDFLQNEIKARTGELPCLFELRRDRRPF